MNETFIAHYFLINAIYVLIEKRGRQLCPPLFIGLICFKF